MIFNPFLQPDRNLRNIWWVVLFFLVLAAFTLPLILVATRNGFEITITHQVIIIVLASVISQALKKRQFSELTGQINISWLKRLMQGMMIGATLMIIPSVLLLVTGHVTWQGSGIDIRTLTLGTFMFLMVAIAEELLFRGFIFQRLIDAFGEWPAQIIISLLFLLTHLDNPGMTGNIKLFASINIFLASILFGLAYIKTRSLAMPIGIHFMANWVQGILLGFGVSGNEQESILIPVFGKSPEYLTGGVFGLEASVPGLICVIAAVVMMYRKQGQKSISQNNSLLP
ncbi:lysostaphin resistance A-like protein [Flavitalea sp.]|nr:type II CAAX endopeptidase family protein [Flavitalea sp.]